MSRALSFIPKFKLNVPSLSKRAETGGCYCVESECANAVYVCDKDEVLYMSASNGFLRMNEEQLKQFVEEAKDVLEDLEYRRIVGINGGINVRNRRGAQQV